MTDGEQMHRYYNLSSVGIYGKKHRLANSIHIFSPPSVTIGKKNILCKLHANV